MELSDTGVDMLSVCPGPVDSKIGDSALLTELSTVSPRCDLQVCM